MAWLSTQQILFSWQQGTDCNISRDFKTVITDLGVCFTFNSERVGRTVSKAGMYFWIETYNLFETWCVLSWSYIFQSRIWIQGPKPLVKLLIDEVWILYMQRGILHNIWPSVPLKLDVALRFNVANGNSPIEHQGKSTCFVYICEIPDIGLGGLLQKSAEQMGLSSQV